MARGHAVEARATQRHHRHWVESTRSALAAAEYAVVVAVVSLALLVVLYLVALASVT
jgi:hypothetical protein